MAEKSISSQSFEKIVLTLDNCLLPKTKLEETPSQRDGLNREIEIDLRILGCELIQTAGILLRLRQVAMATGQVLFQRFYYAKSFVNYNMETTAMSCIYLASKIEESPRQILDVINVFHHIKQMRSQKIIAPMILDQSYVILKTKVVNAERRVLKELGFCVHIKNSPYKLLLMYPRVLGLEANHKLVQCAWNYMNDLLRTDVFVRYQPETIACSCIYLAARKLNLSLPNNPPWYEIFKVTEHDITDVCHRLSELYRRSKPNAEELEQAVEKVKKTYMESKNKGRTGQNISPTPLVTTVGQIIGSHNFFGGYISRAVPVNPEEKSSTEKQSRFRSVSATPKDVRRKYRSRSRTSSKYSETKSRNNSKSPSSQENKHKKRYRDNRYTNGYYKSSPRLVRSRDRARDKSNYYSNGYRRSSTDQGRRRDDRTKYRPRD